MSYTDVVSHWFDRHRGLAPSVMMLRMGLGAIVIPSVAQGLIATLGWHVSRTQSSVSRFCFSTYRLLQHS